jgi:hypothetical protein
VSEKLTIKEAERRQPDLIKNQLWRGTKAKYRYPCEIHGEYLQCFDDHSKGRRCPECGRGKSAAAQTLTIQEAECRQPDLIKGQPWLGTKAEYRYPCATHGVYLQQFSEHSRGRRCNKCAAAPRGTHQKRLIPWAVGQRIPNTSLRFIAEGGQGDYGKRLVTVECGHSNRFEVPLSALKNGHTTSCLHNAVCVIPWESGEAIPGTHFRFIKDLGTHLNWHRRRVILAQCACGKRCEVFLSFVKRSTTASCGCVKASKGEKRIAAFVGQFKSQARFAACKNKRVLPFDFRVIGKNILVEYHGRQHYKAQKYFGGRKKFHIRQRNDAKKRRWAHRSGYKLIEIPYTVRDVEGYLLKRLARLSPDFVFFGRKSRLASVVE